MNDLCFIFLLTYESTANIWKENFHQLILLRMSLPIPLDGWELLIDMALKVFLQVWSLQNNWNILQLTFQEGNKKTSHMRIKIYVYSSSSSTFVSQRFNNQSTYLCLCFRVPMNEWSHFGVYWSTVRIIPKVGICEQHYIA